MLRSGICLAYRVGLPSVGIAVLLKSKNSSAFKSEMQVVRLFSVYPRSNEVG